MINKFDVCCKDIKEKLFDWLENLVYRVVNDFLYVIIMYFKVGYYLSDFIVDSFVFFLFKLCN